MTEEFELKSLSQLGVPAAIEKAKHYRLLNQPAEAESICRDVLDVDPDNQQALVVLVLALTDQLGRSSRSSREATELASRLEDPYQQTYYGGIVRERQARALLRKGVSGVFAYDGFREAMEWYERAHAIRPEFDDDSILRWNACVRAIRNNRLRPAADERELPLE